LFIRPLRSPNELITPNEVVSLDRGLLVIVGAKALSRTKISHLPLRRYPTGRLSVDVDADPPVDQIGIPITAGERLKLYLLQPLRDVLHPGQRPNAVAKHDSPHRKRPYQSLKASATPVRVHPVLLEAWSR